MEKIWVKNYPVDTPENIDVGKETIVDLVNAVCLKYANCKSITCHDETLTFDEVRQLIDNFAYALTTYGVKKGDRVAVIMPNLLQYPIVIFAILKIGAIVVNVNPLYTESEITYIIEDAGAKVAVVLDMMAYKLHTLSHEHKLTHIIVTTVPDLYPTFKRVLMNFVIKYIKRTPVKYAYKAILFRDCIIKKANKQVKVKVVNSDIAFIQYTGATTGKPKGAILTHKNIVANLQQIYAWLRPQAGDLSKHIVIDALPLYHIFSLTANLFTFFLAGSQNIMIPNPREVKSMLKVLKKSNFTVFSALDTLYNHLLLSKEFCSSKFPYFKYSVAGGMPARESVVRRWFEVTHVMPSNCYGMTEASPAVTMSFLDNTFDGSVGYPIPSTEIEIRGIDSNLSLGINETGVIWIRGPQLMSGYWNNPEQTKKAIDKNGWFNTADLGYINNQGKLFIVGRQSDMIIVSGFNVYPVEIENELTAINVIKEAAVIGVKDDDTGERVVAFITLKPNQQISEKEIIEILRKTLTSYKIPRTIVFMKDDLPKTLVGKIDKATLLKQYLGRVK